MRYVVAKTNARFGSNDDAKLVYDPIFVTKLIQNVLFKKLSNAKYPVDLLMSRGGKTN